jgi:GNAT superfamily N-acetyltransferase
MSSDIIVRAASVNDVEVIFKMILAMAKFEKLEDQVVADPAILKEFLFDRQKADVLIAEYQGAPAGYALFFENFSTFEGRTGLYLEDIFVMEEQRSLGIGNVLFRAVATEAVKRGCPRLDWACLKWNQPARDFYESRQGEPLEWMIYRLSGKALQENGEV